MQTLMKEQVLLEPATAQMPADNASLLSLSHHQRQITKLLTQITQITQLFIPVAPSKSSFGS